LTYIDKDNGVAGREAALKLTNLDPCRRIHARTNGLAFFTEDLER